MKKAKEKWIGEQCSELEEDLRKNSRYPYMQLAQKTIILTLAPKIFPKNARLRCYRRSG